MIKKRIAILFTLLANMVLLAHVIVPHHNHDNKVCIENTHEICETNNDCIAKHEHDDDHEHNSEEESECCVLEQVVVIQPNQVKQVLKRFSFQKNHFSFDDYQAVFFDTGVKYFVPILATNIYNPLITSYHIHFVNTAIGLRAPPIV